MKTVLWIGAIVVSVALTAVWLLHSNIGTVAEDPRLSTEHRLELIQNHVSQWTAEKGRLPTEEDLTDMFPATTSKTAIMMDAWHNAVRYQAIAGDPPCVLIYSTGPDGVDNGGTGDDVRTRSNVCAPR